VGLQQRCVSGAVGRVCCSVRCGCPTIRHVTCYPLVSSLFLATQYNLGRRSPLPQGLRTAAAARHASSAAWRPGRALASGPRAPASHASQPGLPGSFSRAHAATLPAHAAQPC
jgi:hypothetical protein